jgi:hypothetical protein
MWFLRCYDLSERNSAGPSADGSRHLLPGVDSEGARSQATLVGGRAGPRAGPADGPTDGHRAARSP